MSPSIAVITAVMLPLPALFAWRAKLSPPPVSLVAWAMSGLILLLYVFILLWSRPRAFELSGDALHIRWPVRHLALALRDLERAEVVTLDQVRAEFGRGVRAGAGGMWGAFGRYVTPSVSMRMYISRLDGLVLLRFSGGALWLISPEDPQPFVDALRASLARPG
jgi:hypothetical protein